MKDYINRQDVIKTIETLFINGGIENIDIVNELINDIPYPTHI